MRSHLVSLTLVVQRPPCGSCQVIEQLTRESLEKVAGADERCTVKLHEVRHPSELRHVEGLEVEKLPALLINGEQVTAGRIVTTRDVKEYLDELDL